MAKSQWVTTYIAHGSLCQSSSKVYCKKTIFNLIKTQKRLRLMLNRTQANACFQHLLRKFWHSDSAAQARHKRYTIPLCVIKKQK